MIVISLNIFSRIPYHFSADPGLRSDMEGGKGGFKLRTDDDGKEMNDGSSAARLKGKPAGNFQEGNLH
jgi:hypothetical protein